MMNKLLNHLYLIKIFNKNILDFKKNNKFKY